MYGLDQVWIARRAYLLTDTANIAVDRTTGQVGVVTIDQFDELRPPEDPAWCLGEDRQHRELDPGQLNLGFRKGVQRWAL